MTRDRYATTGTRTHRNRHEDEHGATRVAGKHRAEDKHGASATMRVAERWWRDSYECCVQMEDEEK